MTDKVICIGREFGSGGRQIGEMLAQRLGVPYYDKEIIQLAAEAGGLDADFISAHEEKAPILAGGMIDRISINNFAYQPSFSDTIFIQQCEIIRDIASKGCSVIVGRCADYVLKGDCVSIFISADYDFKFAQVKGRMGPDCTDEQVKKYMNDIDRARKRYRDHYSGLQWGRACDYDLCIASDKVGFEGAVKTILAFLENLQ